MCQFDKLPPIKSPRIKTMHKLSPKGQYPYNVSTSIDGIATEPTLNFS
jgi:hypothetical protein